MVINFEKKIIFHAEIDDEQFKNESGNIDEDMIINFCEMTDTPTEDNHCWVYNDELKNITYVDSSNNIHKITESEYEHYRLEQERAERCYECSGYGDDYDDEGNCNCDDCPFNSYEDDEDFDYHENDNIETSINPTEFISSFCNKVVEFYEGYVDKQTVIDKVKQLLADTKFSYLEINSNKRIFLFAENPTEFIKDNTLWNYLQNWVTEKYKTFMAIGMYIPNCVDLLNENKVTPIFNIADYVK